MVVAPLPETVWLHYQPHVEKVAEKSQAIFQRVLTDEDYINLIGARTGEMVLVHIDNVERFPGVFVPAIYITHRRIILQDEHSGNILVIYGIFYTDRGQMLSLQKCEVPSFAQRKGLATRLLAEQVVAARAFGFDQIIDYADRSDKQNGYYTWPRLGFDKCLTEEEKSRLPAQFADVTHLSDLIKRPEGRNWWRDQGFPLELIFDTSLGSRSMQLLYEALAREDQNSNFWDSGPDTPLRVERGETNRPRRDWQPRIWQYRR